MRTQWTKGEHNLLKKLVIQGKSTAEQAKALNRSLSSVEAYRLRYITPELNSEDIATQAANKNNNKKWSPSYIEQVKSMVLSGLSSKEIAMKLNTSKVAIDNLKSRYNMTRNDYYTEEDYELIRAKNYKIQQNSSRLQQSVKKYDILYMNLKEYNESLVELLKKRAPATSFKTIPPNRQKCGIVHITDTHFNEIVDLSYNKYDLNIAGARLKYLSQESIRYFTAHNISDVYICLTGDLINSDRRKEELVMSSTNRSKATVIAIDLLSQFINEFKDKYNVTIASVCGNESRVAQDIAWTDLIASDNYDQVIFEMLKIIYKTASVKFIDCDSPLECLVPILSKNILLIHGHQFNRNVDSSIRLIKSKYSDMNIKIDFVLYGHLHQSLISDCYARGGSLVGANGYSSQGLLLSSEASQNIHIVSHSGIDSIKVSLQNSNANKGYKNTTNISHRVNSRGVK